MGAIADIDDLVARATGGNSGTPESIWFTRLDRVAGAAITFLQNRHYSLWMPDGQPGAGVAPTTVAAPTNATNGALKQTDPGGGRQKFITTFQNFLSGGHGSLLIYDRLLHVGGLSGTVTTAQTVGGAITRYTGAESWGNQAWYEINAAIGATATTLSMNYTDENGNPAASAGTVIGGTAFAEQARMQPIRMASGTMGVRGVTDVTLAASTLTAGDIAIVILRPLLELNILQVGGGGCMTFIENIAEVKPGACLGMVFTPHTVAKCSVGGMIGMLEA